MQRAADSERAIERAEQAVAERNRAVTEARDDIDRLRAELERSRTELTDQRREHATEVAALRAESAAALERARGEATQRITALDDARIQTLARAERAERQLDELLAESRREPDPVG